MLTAKMVLTPVKYKPGSFYRNIRCVEGSGEEYYPHYSEKIINVKVRPLIQSDYEEMYRKLGVEPEKIHKDLKQLILTNITSLEDITIAGAFVKIDGIWQNLLFYEEVIN